LGKLTTHVLNTAEGVPAAGVRVRLTDASGNVLGQAVTNADGRCDAPLVEGESLKVGQYRLTFGVGDYFRERGERMPQPPFLNDVEIAFGVADAGAHYHVPLLVSPWAYSTYRGS
jgi:5-hydroxyisourate hydrolase